MCKEEKEFSFKGRVKSIKCENGKYIFTFKGNAVNDNRDEYYAKCTTASFALNLKFEQEFHCQNNGKLEMMLLNCRNEELCVKFAIPDKTIFTEAFKVPSMIKIKSVELIYG